MASSGNFSGWNPRDSYSSGKTFSNGNFTVSLNQQNTKRAVRGPSIPDSGKWYIEFFIDYQTSGFPTDIGVMGQTVNSELNDNNIFTKAGSFIIEPMNGQIFNESTSATSYTGNSGSPSSTGDADAKVGIAIDRDNNKLWFAVNNTWVNVGSGVGDPANGNNPAVSNLENNLAIVTAIREATGTSIVCINCGQDSTFGGRATAQGNTDDNNFGDFFYAPPSGFLAICSGNQTISDNIDPAQTDDDYPGKLFGVVTYTGNGSTQNITGLGFQPDIVWIKERSDTEDNVITDSSRGVTKALRINKEGGSATGTTTDTGGVTAFGSDGFSLGSNSSYNTSSETYVAWCWRINGGTTASNSDGDITATVQANQTAGISIMEWTGNGSSNQTVGHGLGGVPDMWIVKQSTSSGEASQQNYRVGLSTTAGAGFELLSGANDALKLNGYDAAAQMWRPEGNFTPTSTTCNMPNNGNAAAFFNKSSADYIGFCYKSIPGFSKFGLYEGNNTDNDGPFVYTGFRPRMICLKGVDEAYGWYVFDSERSTFNLVDKMVSWFPGGAETTETTGARKVDFLSNGFKVMADAASINGHSDTYLYMAWGDIPYKYNNTF